MGGRTDGWVDGLKDELAQEWKGELLDGRTTNGWVGGRTDGWLDGRMGG
jgi:hypothetical protein